MPIKAIFLDMDETLCDTQGANIKALELFTQKSTELFSTPFNEQQFSEDYLKGVYKELAIVPSLQKQCETEGEFRLLLIQTLLNEQGVKCSKEDAQTLQNTFDEQRMQLFDFFPGCKEMLKRLRHDYHLTVITNGPTFSQYPKLDAVKMEEHVDHILVGGDLVEQGREEKPHPEIFELALAQAKCKASEAIHVGDSLKADIGGANRMNMLNVWINPLHPQEKHFEDAHKPFYTIPNIIELEALLKEI